MKTSIYYMTDKDEFVLVRQYEKGWNYLAGSNTTKRNPWDYSSRYDDQLSLRFCWTPLPINCYFNLKFVGWL